MLLKKADILGKQDLRTETVHVPEWGGDVIIAAISGKQRDAWETSITSETGEVTSENIRAKLVAQCAVDQDGNRLFSDDDIEDLGSKSAAALDRLFAVARRLNGLSKEDVEELAKN